MATKGGKRAAAKKGKTTPSKPAKKAAPRSKKGAGGARSGVAPTGGSSVKAPTPAGRPATPARPPARGPAGPTLLERAESLREAIQRSKLSATDPWSYTAKARAWSQRAQQLVDDLARSGETPTLRHGLETLTAEVERDRDFQEASRRA